MPESRLISFRGRRHVLAGDLLLVDHLGPLLSVSFLPDEELSNHFVQLLEILARPLGSFFVELTDDIFQNVNQCTAIIFRDRPAELIQQTGERLQPIIVVLVRLVRSTVEFIHAVVAVLARQPDLTYERRFVLVGRAPLRPRPISWRRLLPSTLPSPSVPRRQ
jgi:hypothetical protein